MAVATPEPGVDQRPRSARAIAWTRRRRALAHHWRTYRKSRSGMIGMTILLVFILVAVFAPLLVDETQIDVVQATGIRYSSPSLQHWLGTDNFGRDVLSLIIYGARISLLVGLTATIGTMAIGASVGIASGYYGGKIDSFLNGFTNFFLVLPWIVLAIVLASILGRSVLNIILVITITSWAGTTRLVRAQALTVKERPYVERARALGASNWHLITRHILPNVFPVIFANTVLTVALSILAETTLSLLGLGDPNAVSWGGIIYEAFIKAALSSGYWWWIIPPGIAIVLVTLSFTMCGYALDEILDPKLRER